MHQHYFLVTEDFAELEFVNEKMEEIGKLNQKWKITDA